MAQAYRRVGSRVTVVEHGPRLAGREDPDVPVAIGQILSDEGIEVLLATETLRVNGRHAIPRCVKKVGLNEAGAQLWPRCV